MTSYRFLSTSSVIYLMGKLIAIPNRQTFRSYLVLKFVPFAEVCPLLLLYFCQSLSLLAISQPFFIWFLPKFVPSITKYFVQKFLLSAEVCPPCLLGTCFSCNTVKLLSSKSSKNRLLKCKCKSCVTLFFTFSPRVSRIIAIVLKICDSRMFSPQPIFILFHVNFWLHYLTISNLDLQEQYQNKVYNTKIKSYVRSKILYLRYFLGI